MSSELAIAGVSAVLRDRLNDRIIDHAAADVLGHTVVVSVGPPDRVIPQSGAETTQLNLFMYHVTPNTGWRNEGLPSRDSTGTQRLSNPPLALNLHYLISAHASEDFHGDILLGYAMKLLHEYPVLSRSDIRKALADPSPASAGSSTLWPTLLALKDSGLADQIEQIKLTPEYLGTDEMSRLWTATQSHLRPAAAYMASVVLIQAKDRVSSGLPVLRRGDEDQGVFVQLGASPLLQTVHIGSPDDPNRRPLPPTWPAAQLGALLAFRGTHLDGNQLRLRFEHPLMSVQEITVPPADRDAVSANLTVPDDTAAQTAWAAGIYSVSALVDEGGTTRHSNALAVPLAPHIKAISNNVARVAGDATIAVQGNPEFPVDAQKVSGVWKLTLKQKILLLLAGYEVEPEALPDSSATTPPSSVDNLTFVIKEAPAVSGEIARLRVDGVDSLPFVRRNTPPPARLVLDDNQRVSIT